MNCRWCGDPAPGAVEFCSDDCATSYAEETSPAPVGPLPTPTVADILDAVEAAKPHWSAVIKQGILDAAARHPDGEFFADALEPLGIPDEHRNLIGAQTRALASKKWLRKTDEYRASTTSSRHGNGSWVWKLTPQGRAAVAPPAPLSLVPGSVGAERPLSAHRDAEAA